MFDLPAAKRVRRSDLYSPLSSPDPYEPDPELAAILHSQLENFYGPALADVIKHDNASESAKNIADDVSTAPLHHEIDEEQGFEFRLFAAPSETKATSSGPHGNNATAPLTTTRIMLVDDTEDLNGTGGFTVPRRDPQYYFSSPPTAAQKRAFELAAVSGEDVLVYKDVPYSGWAVPWRVRILRNGVLYAPIIKQIAAKEDKIGSRATDRVDGYIVGDLPGSSEQTLEERDKHKRKKPNKKRRIVLRSRQKKVEEDKRRIERQKRDREMAEKEKEEREREKKTRRNREKKIKKRLKEKAKKDSEAGTVTAVIIPMTTVATVRRDASNTSSGSSIK